MIICIDFETTGLINEYSLDPEDQPGIVQIGMVRLDHDLVEEESFNEMVNPELRDTGKWAQEAQDISNITPDDVVGKPTFFSIFPRFAEFVRGSKYLIGYNHTGFDIPVLDWQLKRYGCQHNFPWPPRHLEIMDLASEYMDIQGKRGRKNPKLVEVYKELMGVELTGAHDALTDVRGTVDVLRKLGGLKAFGLC